MAGTALGPGEKNAGLPSCAAQEAGAEAACDTSAARRRFLRRRPGPR